MNVADMYVLSLQTILCLWQKLCDFTTVDFGISKVLDTSTWRQFGAVYKNIHLNCSSVTK